MAPKTTHPRAEPYLWPLLCMGGMLSVQVALVQVALNRLVWGMYGDVFAPVAGTLALSGLAWLVYRQSLA